MTWRYRLTEPYQYRHPVFDGVSFSNRWATISKGKISIWPYYAWDGCSPSCSIMGICTIGTPDGALRFGKPWTWQASLVHDVLCQFRHKLPLDKQQVTRIFNDQLAESGWPLRKLYVCAVYHFGPQDFGES